MNQTAPATSATGASLLPDWIGAYTTAHFVWIGVLAVLAVLAILWGSRLAARRKTAEREIGEHNAELAAEAAPPPPTPAPPRSAPAAFDPHAFAPAPIRAAPPPPASVAVAPAPVVPIAPVAAAEPPADGPPSGPVTQLKGLGPKVAARLAELGITTVGQIAALTDDEAADLDAQLGTFRGRLTRDRWIEQARFLAAGDRAGFESVFGRL